MKRKSFEEMSYLRIEKFKNIAALLFFVVLILVSFYFGNPEKEKIADLTFWGLIKSIVLSPFRVLFKWFT
ncbi:hypothetical protein [Kaistella pullorum]|uniref:Uncharacterized protein n=1 Tax=Kaistella pullorum TaxID=2763074 RepID=A0ABR8WJ77_9FLAO|nr:hypothetical protein [Kaistella pullorum]MBD8017125.1 hypothetical protein [Kaistella pullorum]